MLTMRGLIAIVISVLFVGIAYSTEHPNLKTAEPKNSAEAEQRGSDKNPLTIKVLPSPGADTKAAQEEKHRNEKAIQDQELVDATVFLGRVTTFLAVFTALLWCATYKLASDAKKAAAQQARDMQSSLRTAEQLANASTQSAQSSTEMVATMERNARNELRAYVGVESPQIHHGRDGDPPSGKLIIRNFGKTMAKDTEIWINGVMATGDITEFPLGDRKLKTVVMPNEALGGLTHNFVRPKDGFTHIYLWGSIKYNDVFEESHCTIFCFVNADDAYFPTYGGPTIGWSVKNYGEDRNTAT